MLLENVVRDLLYEAVALEVMKGHIAKRWAFKKIDGNFKWIIDTAFPRILFGDILYTASISIINDSIRIDTFDKEF